MPKSSLAEQIVNRLLDQARLESTETESSPPASEPKTIDEVEQFYQAFVDNPEVWYEDYDQSDEAVDAIHQAYLRVWSELYGSEPSDAFSNYLWEQVHGGVF